MNDTALARNQTESTVNDPVPTENPGPVSKTEKMKDETAGVSRSFTADDVDDENFLLGPAEDPNGAPPVEETSPSEDPEKGTPDGLGELEELRKRIQILENENKTLKNLESENQSSSISNIAKDLIEDFQKSRTPPNRSDFSNEQDYVDAIIEENAAREKGAKYINAGLEFLSNIQKKAAAIDPNSPTFGDILAFSCEHPDIIDVVSDSPRAAEILAYVSNRPDILRRWTSGATPREIMRACLKIEAVFEDKLRNGKKAESGAGSDVESARTKEEVDARNFASKIHYSRPQVSVPQFSPESDPDMLEWVKQRNNSLY